MAASAETAGSIPANEARDYFADLLGRAQHGKERVVISRHGKPVAALVPLKDLKLLEEIDDRLDAEEGRATLAKWKRAGRKSTPLDRVIRELGIKA
ncbi:MAG: type II toxin-antitoxin system Phd/YefM family antitoxin [Pseudomonadota bacterium]